MAINSNLLSAATPAGGRLLLNPFPAASTAPAAPAAAPAAPPTMAAAPPAAVVASRATTVATLNPALIAANNIFRPPILFPAPQVKKSSTQLAAGAITQLTGAAAASVTQAINATKSKSLNGAGMIPYLERKVRIGEVLNDLAKDWSATTRSDFADAFNMDPNTVVNEVVDSIVSIAILNDKDLDGEILFENTPATTTTDLTDNRRVVWQSVPAGTVLNPPYVILLAVEYQDVAQAEDSLKTITDQLGLTGSGFRLPTVVIQKGVN
jgi:hypothetical protein